LVFRPAEAAEPALTRPNLDLQDVGLRGQPLAGEVDDAQVAHHLGGQLDGLFGATFLNEHPIGFHGHRLRDTLPPDAFQLAASMQPIYGAAWSDSTAIGAILPQPCQDAA
jgi:hypothetical protein